jgi:Ca2+-binding EF-hand superfamily protein
MQSRTHVLYCALLLAAGAAAADDGGLTRAETERRAPRLARHFEAIDANGDGRISAREIRAWRKVGGRRGATARARFDELFRRADADGDGALSRAEAQASFPRLARKFGRLDADGDGRLTLDEVHAWLDARRGALRAGAPAR